MKEITKIFWEFFKAHPIAMVLNVSYSCLVPIQDVLLPHLYGKVMTSIEQKRNFMRPFITVIVLMSCLQIGHMLSDWHDAKLFPQLQGFIRKEMLAKLFENFENNFQDLFMGDIMGKFVKIPHHLLEKFQRMKNFVVPYTISYIIATVYFMMTDLYLGLGLAVLVGSFILLVVGSPYTCKKVGIERDDAQNVLNEEVDDVLRNLISIYGSGQDKYELDRLAGFEKNYENAFAKAMRCILGTRSVITPMMIAFFFIFMVRCNKNFKEGKLTSGKFVSLFVVLLYMLSSMITMTDEMKDMVFEEGIINGFEGTFKQENVPRPPSLMLDKPENIPGIYMHDVTFSHSKLHKPILQHFSLHISPGQKLAIVGDIGSGKSTILKLLLKLYEPCSGEIFFNGIPYSLIDLKELRKRIGYVPQQPILFNRSVIENIKYGNDNVRDEDIINIMRDLNLEKEFTYLENGLHTKIGKNGSKISGGQRQLVWCLRVLLGNPEVLILDEPTASLDEKSKTLMKALFDRFMQNRTVVMVTHDPSLTRYAERIITLKKGTIVSDESSKHF